MLEIFVNGISLDLTPDITFNLVIENPFISNDFIPSPFSLTFTLPPSRKNLIKLGNPDRVSSNGSFQLHENCIVRFESIGFSQGTLLVKSFQDNLIQAFYQGSLFADNIINPLSDCPIHQYNFGNGTDAEFPFATSTWKNAYVNLIQASKAGSEKFVAAPIFIPGMEWPTPDLTVDGHKALLQSYFNAFNGWANKYTFDTVLQNDFMHGVIFPQIFIHDIIEAVIGNKLVANIFASGELANLVAITSYHFNLFAWPEPFWQASYLLQDNTDLNSGPRFMELKSFLPSTPFNEMLKDLLKLICATMYMSGNKYDIQLNKDILNSTTVENWESIITDNIIISKQSGQPYKYGYADFPQQKSLSGYATLSMLTDILTEPFITAGEIFKIANTGQFFRKFYNDDGNPDYEPYDPGFGGSSDLLVNPLDMTVKLSPLKSNIVDYWKDNNGNPIPKRKWVVPIWEGDRVTRPDKMNIMIWQGLTYGFNMDLYPFLSAHNFDKDNHQLGNLSLAWDGPYGLINNYHLEYQAWVAKDKTLITDYAKLNALDLKNLDLKTKKHVRGKNFFVSTISVTIRRNTIDLAQIDFIEG